MKKANLLHEKFKKSLEQHVDNHENKFQMYKKMIEQMFTQK